ncbi:hypothetical protein [Thiohalophilus sp.]|uniref:hypothetical protein n=1 Tax=Thiohalophilus sp. TaxID=3028392 RepID=UPI002ACE785B|nr:hypothetical protein [Thiohalophilus sp.]MDZ7802361.1 hypothetical protein [Thiohalophilus sp.]
MYEVQSFSESQYTALKAKQDADEMVDLRIRSLDDNEADEVEEGFSVKLQETKTISTTRPAEVPLPLCANIHLSKEQSWDFGIKNEYRK